jgi:hypothetical protein
LPPSNNWGQININFVNLKSKRLRGLTICGTPP